jgi:hypothetical protein
LVDLRRSVTGLLCAFGCATGAEPVGTIAEIQPGFASFRPRIVRVLNDS